MKATIHSRPSAVSLKVWLRETNIWTHFGFYEQPGKHDLEKKHAVCKSCHAQIKYAGGDTTN